MFLDLRAVQALEGFPDDFGDVLDLDRVTARHVQPAVLEVGDAVGASGYENLRSDADRLARFQREAEVLATFNHPNIGASTGSRRHLT